MWVVGYHRNSVGVTPAAWTRMSISPRPGWGTRAVPAIKTGASKESLKRMTLIVLMVSNFCVEVHALQVAQLPGHSAAAVRTLLGDGALHHEYEGNERDREHGKDEEGVEIGERGGLLLAQVFE